jgi:uncharacterized protein YbjT (DUF2867 family)
VSPGGPPGVARVGSITGLVLVVGASGRVGRRVAHTLLDEGVHVRLLARPGADVAGLVERGGARMEGDLRDAGSLWPALDGVYLVIVTATGARGPDGDTPAVVDDAGVGRLIDVAQRSGVRRLVVVTAAAARPDSPHELLRAKAAEEEHAARSALAWTVIAPDMSMESWVGSLVAGPAEAGETVTLVDGAPARSLVADADVVAAVVAAARRGDTAGRRLPIGGPDRLSWEAVCEAWADRMERRPAVRHISAAEALARRDHLALLLEPVGASEAQMAAAAAHLGLSPTPLAAWLGTQAREPSRR